ncbi:hypothetical protein J132_04178 [Termitomyces sp. J132]|nr:hypothetical protein J132_04178 [Termitomyces sp. J132]
MTQYLAQVQGIPSHIETLLSRRANRFMWAGKSSLVNAETMFKPLHDGGRVLVDIKNKAINIMWLRSYLKFGSEQPMWAKVADVLMAMNAPKNMRTIVSSHREICPDIMSIIKTAKEFNVRPEGLAFSREIMEELPIWYHFAADPKIHKMNSGKVVECLKAKHKVKTVGEASELANILLNCGHVESDECECPGCMMLENTKGCLHPHLCVNRVNNMLNTLPSKWDPRAEQPDDRINQMCSEHQDEDTSPVVCFNARLATEGSMADLFRIFMTGPMYHHVYLRQNRMEDQTLLVAYIGRKSHTTRKNCGVQIIGAGVHFENMYELNASEMWISSEDKPKKGSTLLAVLLTSMRSGINKPLVIKTRDKDVILSLTKDTREKEDSGFVDTMNSGLLQIVLGRLRMHTAPVTFMDLDGTQVSMYEKKATSLAKAALKKERPILLPPIPTELHLTGAKLSKITQAIAYKTIMKIKSICGRPQMGKTMESIISHVKGVNRRSPSRKQIWSSLRCKDFSKPLQMFLWKCAHDAYKVGMYWDKPSMDPVLRERARCKHDGEVDSMEHILTKCKCTGQGLVWSTVREMWKNKTDNEFPETSLGSILGSALLTIKDEEGKPSQGLTRLYKIVVTEVASFIWAIRCERVIRHDDVPLSEVEISNRWNAALKKRAETDFKLTNRRLGKKSIPLPPVIETWKDTRVVDMTPWQGSQYMTMGGVLVGSMLYSRDGIG